MSRKNNFIASCMHYNRLVIFLTTIMVILGIIGLKQMPKQESPEFTIRQGIVVGVYPGAKSSQVEEELTKPLERFLFTYAEVKRAKTQSISKDGIVYVMVELNDNVKDKDKVWSKIKLGVQGFKQQLPPEVLALVVQDDFGDTSALLISMESDDKTYRELADYMEKLEDRLLQLESVSNLRRFGVQNEQISIYVDKRKLAGYGIDQRMFFAELSSSGVKSSGGNLTTEDNEIPIYFSESYMSEQDIANKVIYIGSDGNSIRIKDVARVVREYPDPDSYIRNNGMRTVLLSMEMRTGYNIVEYGERVDEILREFEHELPPSIQIERIADQPKVVEESVNSFLRDLAIAIIIVIIVMLLLFSWRSALIAAATIPITIFISLGIMFLVGIPLNTVTLAALILVLGMIVDNSIVVLDAYVENLDNGMSRWHAAIYSAKKYFGSIMLATLCITIIFFPFLFIMEGMIRDFVALFPWTIAITLMISLIVSATLIPFMEYSFIKKGLKSKDNKKASGFSMLNLVQSGYEKALRFTMNRPALTASMGVASVVVAALIFVSSDIKLMPMADRDQFAVEIYLPEGSALSRTAEIAESVQTELSKDERVKSITSFVGMASPRFQTTYAPNLPGKNYGQFIVNTASNKATIEILDEYANHYANLFPNAYVRFKQLDYNKTATQLEVRFQGDDITQLKIQADSLMQYLHTIDALTWIHTNYTEPIPAIEIKMDPLHSSRMGVSAASTSMQLAMLNSGVPAGEIWEGDYRLPLVLKSEYAGSHSHIDDPSMLEHEYINSMIPKVSMPLKKVADVDATWSEGQIIRRGGIRTLSVIADYKRCMPTADAQRQVVNYVNSEVIPNLPHGVTCHFGGVIEADAEDLPPALLAIIYAMVLIFVFLLFEFKRIGISFVSLFALLLSLLGAALGLVIAGLPIGVTALMGVVSLMGIVVRNVILIFQHADDKRINHDWTAYDAAYDAGARRMVPIFLTSATTAMGVIPMIISKSPLWYPMGVVICSGTICAMILVVFILPSVYTLLYRKNDKTKIDYAEE